jgi:hypothetical protein
MHRHRTWWNTWRGVWVAGFTRAKYGNHLFYLMQVGEEADSQFNLWHSLLQPDRDAKSASFHACGDLYKPLPATSNANSFDPSFYEKPVSVLGGGNSNHVHLVNNVWHRDICYRYPPATNAQPKLLVGIPRRSFLWSVPKYSYQGLRYHPRFKCYPSLGAFYGSVKCKLHCSESA